MLWSPSEVLAFLNEDLSVPDGDLNTKVSSTAAFGGFQTWPSPKEDFILVAENSEIHGPNPLFTIPLQSSEVDLNLLSTKILSADYQGLSNQKTISLETAQLLMPDIANDLHAAIIYFLLFDTEARGFIRPTCLAYFTSDKNKLICFADSILKNLTQASAILQHNNVLNCAKDLKDLMNRLKHAQSDSVSNNSFLSGEAEKPINLTQSILQDIQDVLDVIEGYKVDKIIEKQTLNILDKLRKTVVAEEMHNFLSSSIIINESQEKKAPFQNSHKTYMKHLYIICSGGIVLGLYHLYITHKHFRRKYVNIALSQEIPGRINNCLLFGSCLKESTGCTSQNIPDKNCVMCIGQMPKAFSLENENYLCCLDNDFEKLLLNYLKWHPLQSSEKSNAQKVPPNLMDTSLETEYSKSFTSRNLSSTESKSHFQTLMESSCGHIVTLNEIWDVIDSIKKLNPGIESTFLKILKLFDENQSLLYCMLTRSPIIVISTPKELNSAQNFLKALSVFIPRQQNETLYVDVNKRGHIKEENFKSMAAANICFENHYDVENLVPFELLPSLCILNLKDCSLTAPGYTGVLLSDVNERIRAIPADGPVFSVIVSVLCEIQRTVQWWRMVSCPTIDSSAASNSILSKSFSRMDMQIILKLSSLCQPEISE